MKTDYPAYILRPHMSVNIPKLKNMVLCRLKQIYIHFSYLLNWPLFKKSMVSHEIDILGDMAVTLRLTNPLAFSSHPLTSSVRFRRSKSIVGTEIASFRTVKMAAVVGSDPETTSSSTSRVIDSHLHVWASPQEVVLLQFFQFESM